MKALPSEPEIITRKGKPLSVILPVILEWAEDAQEVAWLKRARRKNLRYRPLAEYLAKRSGK